jgi:hypothetical protein
VGVLVTTLIFAKYGKERKASSNFQEDFGAGHIGNLYLTQSPTTGGLDYFSLALSPSLGFGKHISTALSSFK